MINTSIIYALSEMILCVMPLLVILYFKKHLTIGNDENDNKSRDFKYIIHHKESLFATS